MAAAVAVAAAALLCGGEGGGGGGEPLRDISTEVYVSVRLRVYADADACVHSCIGGGL